MSGKLAGLSKKEDKRLSVCKLCGEGIFSNQEYIWANNVMSYLPGNPLLSGLIHVGCLG